MKNEITITVSGKAMTGKSKIANLIGEFLSDKGAQIKIDESNILNEAINKNNQIDLVDLKDYNISLSLLQEKF